MPCFLKPSELTPATAVRLGELLRDAGVPESIMQVLPGDGLTGAALANAAIDKLFFTGSAATGRKVATACAQRLIPCALELGGSDPAIVLDDADLDTAASGIVWGRFTNAAKRAVAPKRAIVSTPFTTRRLTLAAAAERLVVGAGSAGSDVGPMIRPCMSTCSSHSCAMPSSEALTSSDRARSSHFFAPTILTNVSPEMRVAREETFGPCWQ